MKAWIKRYITEESGQTTTEYGLLLGFLGLAVVVTLAAMRGNVGTLFTKANDALNNAANNL
jgi:Flp pilus assembly pilin Flp